MPYNQVVYFQVPQLHAASAPQPLTLGEIILAGLGVLGGVYLLFQEFSAPEQRRVRCGHCGLAHTTRSCPRVGERRNFSSAIEKTGWCECCDQWFPKTQLHHYAGRCDDSKGMEMCLPCHLHCGHEGHFQNFAIRPKFCRNVA